MTAEKRLEWLAFHRGESVANLFLCEFSKKLDAEIVEETMAHIIGGYYIADDPDGFADSGEDPEDVFANQICKHCYALKRERKIADNKEHMRKLALKKGEIIDGRTAE